MPDKNLQPLDRPLSLPESVQRAIRAFIRDNHLKSGDVLPPETQLTKQLGVSRNAVREAVKALEITGIVEVRRGSGLFVGEFSLDPLLESLPYSLMTDLRELRELLEIRQVLETGMMQRVIGQITQDHIDRLRDILQRMGHRAENEEPFPEEDREFHQCLIESVGNQTLSKLLDIFWKTYHRASRLDELEDPPPLKTYLDHVAIVDAVVARDVEAAITALETHYTGLGSLSFRLNQVERRKGLSHDGEETS